MLDEARLTQIRDRLGHRPWAELTLDDLAGAAGVSRVTLHRWGIGREDIRAGLIRLLEAEYRDAALPALVSDAAAPDRLAAVLRSVCAVDERYLGLLDALGDHLDALFHEDTATAAGETLTRATYTDPLQRILADGARDGTLRLPHDGAESATLLFNATGWTYRHMRIGHRWPPEKASARVVELLVDGVRA
jgi:AcrR family transcriptional regulator